MYIYIYAVCQDDPGGCQHQGGPSDHACASTLGVPGTANVDEDDQELLIPSHKDLRPRGMTTLAGRAKRGLLVEDGQAGRFLGGMKLHVPELCPWKRITFSTVLTTWF